jgi:hypothetical protein
VSEQPDAETFGTVTFWYRNYRGEISRRVAAILGLRWGSSEYHKEPQWLLRGFDLEKEAEREFAIKDMAPTREALAQSDAGPVAWQRRYISVPLGDWKDCEEWQFNDKQKNYEYRALYTAPPRPDASGLIEAAEWHIISEALRIAREDGSIDNFATDTEYEALKEKVRARAADRSAPRSDKGEA